MSIVAIMLLVWLGWPAGGGAATTTAEPASAAPPACWPQFRGVSGAGVAAGGDMPVHFGPASNMVWKTALPAGNSSPCLWGDRLFLTAFENNELLTLCLDRATGQVLWRRAVPPTRIERSTRLSNPASPTPATDGRRVLVYFGPFGLVCYDFDGREQWRRPLPVPVTQHGASTSPVLGRELLFLACDQDVGSHLLAVRPQDGHIAWRAERPDFRRGFSTPLIWHEGEREQVILAGTLRLVAYDARTGREDWRVRGLPNEVCASPVAGDGLIFAAGWTPGAGVAHLPTFQALLDQGDKNGDGKLSHDEAPAGPARQHFFYNDADKDGLLTRAEWESIADIFSKSENALLAVRPGGRGDVTDSHVAWRQKRGLPYVPSPLFYQGRVYLVRNGGLMSCFNATTGAPLYQEERLGALGDNYASPVAAGGKICVASQAGVVVVLAAGDSLQVLARNPLGEPVLATPAVAGGRLYVRTEKHLFCFGPPLKPASK